jgi:hypothetical protein
MNTKPDVVGEIRALPIRARVAFALGVAEAVVDELSEDPEGLAMARESLRRSWQWVSGAKVSAFDVGEYVDGEGPEETDLALRQGYYLSKRPMVGALNATHLAVAYAASKAYDLEGLSKSAVISELNDDFLDHILILLRHKKHIQHSARRRASQPTGITCVGPPDSLLRLLPPRSTLHILGVLRQTGAGN